VKTGGDGSAGGRQTHSTCGGEGVGRLDLREGSAYPLDGSGAQSRIRAPSSRDCGGAPGLESPPDGPDKNECSSAGESSPRGVRECPKGRPRESVRDKS